MTVLLASVLWFNLCNWPTTAAVAIQLAATHSPWWWSWVQYIWVGSSAWQDTTKTKEKVSNEVLHWYRCYFRGTGIIIILNDTTALTNMLLGLFMHTSMHFYGANLIQDLWSMLFLCQNPMVKLTSWVKNMIFIVCEVQFGFVTHPSFTLWLLLWH